MSCTGADAGRRREWLVSGGHYCSSANENISSKCSIGIDKFVDRVHAAMGVAARELLSSGENCDRIYIESDANYRLITSKDIICANFI